MFYFFKEAWFKWRPPEFYKKGYLVCVFLIYDIQIKSFVIFMNFVLKHFSVAPKIIPTVFSTLTTLVVAVLQFVNMYYSNRRSMKAFHHKHEMICACAVQQQQTPPPPFQQLSPCHNKDPSLPADIRCTNWVKTKCVQHRAWTRTPWNLWGKPQNHTRTHSHTVGSSF